MYSILAPLLVLVGLAGVVLVVARALPSISQIPEPDIKTGAKIAEKVSSLAKKVPWQKWFFGSVAFGLKQVRRALFAGLKKSEKMVHAAQTRSRKFASEGGVDALPKFFDRIKKRRAFLEEERKLLEYVGHHPDDAAAYKRLGTLYAISGNVKDARAAFEQSLRLNPDDQDILQKLEELA